MAIPKLLIALDMQDNRLEKAKEFGADLVFNPGKYGDFKVAFVF